MRDAGAGQGRAWTMDGDDGERWREEGEGTFTCPEAQVGFGLLSVRLNGSGKREGRENWRCV